MVVNIQLTAWLRSALLGLALWCALPMAWATNLNMQWSVLLDRSEQLQAEQIFTEPQNWSQDARQGFYGYSPGVLWARFKVPAVPAGAKGWLLSVGYPYLDRIDIYSWGQTTPWVSMGDTILSEPPPLSYASHVVRLPALAEETSYLLRVQTTSALNVRAQLLTDEELLIGQSSNPFKAGIFITLYLLTAIMYAVGAIVMRQAVQLGYSAYLLCLLAIFVGVNQPILFNAWLGSAALANWVTGFGILLAPAVSCLLWIIILQLRSNSPRLFKAYLGIIAYCLLSMLSVNTPYYRQAAQTAVLGILVISIVNLVLALWAMRRPERRVSIGLFVLAFFLSTATAIANNLSVAGVIPAQPWFAAAFDMSSLVHVLILGIATNRSIRVLETAHREGLFQQRLLTTQRDQIQSFSAFVAHELLGPLARIGRSAEMLLRDSSLAERAGKRVTDIRLWAFETGKLVEAFLNSASLESGQVVVKPERVQLNTWAKNVQAELTLNYAHATLVWTLPPDAAPVTTSFDPLLAKLALENIVINALKYAGADKPVQIRLAVDRNGHAEFTVEDQGPGLEPEQYAQIGQTVQLRKPNQDKPGFGLGLSLVAHIARAHGGSFSASPGQTQGVCWVLKLGQS